MTASTSFSAAGWLHRQRANLLVLLPALVTVQLLAAALSRTAGSGLSSYLSGPLVLQALSISLFALVVGFGLGLVIAAVRATRSGGVEAPVTSPWRKRQVKKGSAPLTFAQRLQRSEIVYPSVLSVLIASSLQSVPLERADTAALSWFSGSILLQAGLAGAFFTVVLIAVDVVAAAYLARRFRRTSTIR